MDTNTQCSYIQAYLALGWRLVPIPRGQKGPTYDNWNVRTDQPFPLDWDGNLGLALAYCQMMTFDQDDVGLTRGYLQERGISLDAMTNAPDTVQIQSGKPGHAKLIYRMPAWCDTMRTRKVNIDGRCAFELRNATKSGLTVQDVLPPSIHPETGQPYQWVGDFTKIPEIPPELLQLWLDLTTPKVKASSGTVNVQLDQVADALKHIDPDLPRDEWIQVGMALHSVDPDAVDLFDQWSARGSKYVGHDINSVWDSFDQDDDGVTVGTLFHYAKDAGWPGYTPDLGLIFGEPGTPVQVTGQPLLTDNTVDPPKAINLAAELRGELSHLPPFVFGDEALTRPVTSILLRSLTLSQADQVGIQELIHGYTNWTREQMKGVVKELKNKHREMLNSDMGMDDLKGQYLYIATLHLFYHKQSGEMLKPEAFMSLHFHMDEDIRKRVLSTDGVTKVTGIDFDPAEPEYFTRQGATYFNQWTGLADYGIPGDITPWMDHFIRLIPDQAEREHIMDWMAYTLQNPGEKINHAIVMNGRPGVGKDAIFWPLTKALGKHARHIQAQALLSDFNDYLLQKKLLIVQEPDLGNHQEAGRIANNLKSVIASPPEEININRKGVPAFPIKNVCSLVLLTNESDPVRISIGDRRYFVVASPLMTQDADGNLLPGWKEFFDSFWGWLFGGGGRHVVQWLMQRDISKFNAKSAPMMTDAKQDVIRSGQSPLGAMITYMKENKVGPLGREITTTEQVQQWCQFGEGLKMQNAFGLKELPNLVNLGRTIAHETLSERLRRRIDGKTTRVHVFDHLRRWNDATNVEIETYLDDFTF